MFYDIVYYIIVLAFIIKLFMLVTKGECRAKQNLNGKCAIVTGGNSGIGYETALNLAMRGCKVIIADSVDSEESCKQIIQETGNILIFYEHLDLASLKSVREFAKKMNEIEERLDILINNAGCVSDAQLTDDGLLKVMQINYFGPFLLTHLLADLMRKTKNGRIVFVASIRSYFCKFKVPDDIYSVLKTNINFLDVTALYNNAKLCNILAAKVFARKLFDDGILCNSVHPGIMGMKFYECFSYNSYIINAMLLIYKLFGKDTYEGAQTSLHCALLKEDETTTGEFFIDCCPFDFKPSTYYDENLIDGIWKLSENAVQLSDNEKL